MRRLVVFNCLFFLSATLWAQQENIDSIRPDQTAVYAKHIYDAGRAKESAIYNGRQFYPYLQTIQGIAFFEFPDWQKGSVVYDGVLYEDILMKYDLVKGQLIIVPANEDGLLIALFSPRVSEFSFSGYKFIRLGNNDGSGLQQGFYQVLEQGKLIAVARKTKLIYERIVDRSVERSFEFYAKYYVLKDGEYHHIKNANDLLDMVKDRRREIQQLLSSKKLKFRKAPEITIQTAIEAYNRLAN